MANKRQRLARKCFLQHTDATPDPSYNSTKFEKKAQTNHKKRKRVQHAENGVVGDPADHIARKKPKRELGSIEGMANKRIKVKKLSKHPLRVAGKMPGDGCFICKAADHIAKECLLKQEKDRKKVCLFCRVVGHTLKNCPKKQDVQEMKICYNCGGVGHRLAECMDVIRDGGTTFAECFVCKQKGHLSKNCPSNTHGIYPKGGSCKVCGSITHLAKDCPKKGTGQSMDSGSEKVKLQISKEVAHASLRGNSKRIVFGSGDDLKDDFFDAGNDQGIRSGSETYEESSHASRKQLIQKDRKMKNGLTLLKPVVKKVGERTSKVVNFFQ